ncbi:MFS transporter [Novosphingobium umbonatum]|uniref:MFS transporter n=1 Tax=Novosphingobium umbonatum TaxID=1908524 RepID=A0A3S2YD35_9SPHN|nr:MFS transporter [Novosphingobium umbonatum]RVU07962.1 MFS transporter [Novosphingobium umbonatum]
MGWRQILGIILCTLLNALDGFDVLSISFASPGIAAEWHVDRKVLGYVLSMEIFGMAAGSMLLGRLTDRIGRIPTMVICLVIMAAGMLLAPHADGVTTLALIRLLTGLGIGGMLAATNAVAAEYANDRWRSAAVALMAAGYPLGAVVGGTIASAMLKTGGWRDVFYLGAGLALVLLPLVPWLMPEPVGALLQRRPANVLERVNKSLRAFGHSAVEALPEVQASTKIGMSALFKGTLGLTTLLLVLAYFAHILTFYFVVKWVPKIVSDMGFPASSAGGVLVWANVGGLIGALIFSFSALRFPLRPALIVMMLASVALVAWFGQTPADLSRLSLAAAMAAFCTNSVIVGFYALIAQSFPTALRGSGTGVVIGVGRLGAAAGPIVAGYLFEAKLGLPLVAAFMALGSLAAAAALLVLPKSSAQGH